MFHVSEHLRKPRKLSSIVVRSGWSNNLACRYIGGMKQQPTFAMLQSTEAHESVRFRFAYFIDCLLCLLHRR